MTSDEPQIGTRAELRAELQSLLRRAHAGDVDVQGGWECRNGPEHPDWDVIVTEVETEEASD